jgi:virginiamycin B lyase
VDILGLRHLEDASGRLAMRRPSIATAAGAFSYALVSAVAQAQSAASELPDGAGKEVVEAVCTGCHQTDQITRSSGYSRAGWQELIGTMIDLSGSPEERDRITRYLATHFPPHDRQAPKLIPGEAEIAFKEWQVPTLGQRARDPVEAADGSIWWSGQWGNLIGQIKPATGEMTEYPLPAGAMPHTVTLDGAGNVWYTGNKNGTIGMLDPDTGEITVHEMPDPAAKDPHTAVFDAEGILWFTLQQSNMVGRLDPASGDIRLVTMPTPASRPYGIKIDAEGSPWVACNGSNCLVRVDPKTMALTEIELPIPETTVRRLDIAADGMIWYVNSSQGRLGRFDPRTGVIREWPSPSGPDSHPYALAVVDGIVWYNESGKRPDALVRFDPATETFQSWPIPSGGVYAGIVRHMRPTRDGNLLIHQSSTNRIILVTLDGAAGS